MSERSKPLRLVAAAAAIAVLGAALWWRGDAARDGEAEPSEASAAAQREKLPEGTRSAIGPQGRVSNVVLDDAEAIRRLQALFGDGIANKRVQIKALEQVVAWLQKNYPDDWRDRLYAFLQQAFPGMADELFARFEQMETWNEWWKANRARLAELPAAERRAEVWDQRLRAFGDEAVEIWEESLRNEAVLDALEQVSRSPDTDVAEKLDTYLDAIEDAYGEDAARLIESRQTELMDRFLETPAVQDNLHALPSDQRRRELRRVREGLGMDEAALDRWDELDRARDTAWETGERYMDERQRLAESYEGDELIRRLDDLRVRTFGPDADVIRSEEEGGFFRFDHRRTFGKE